MSDLGRKMAKGAAWMVLLKLAERSLGILVTLVLARLLVPADFGIVAMATSVIALLDLLTGFSFDIALIQKQNADRRHYDAAWTLNILTYALMAVLMGVLAGPIAAFYREPRVESVLYVLAVGVFVTGLENIGTVAFRKDLALHKEFGFLLGKKLAAAAVGIAIAVTFRSYWALVAGMVTSRVVGVALSYAMHPFRPRVSFDRARELLHFSRWLFASSAAYASISRLPDFVIGRIGGPDALGVYNVGLELSTLPSTELMMPINRAVFAGYARMADDTDSLRNGFLTVISMAALVIVPAAAGIAAIAEPLVHVLLGQRWVAAIPVIQILAFYGLVHTLQANTHNVCVAAARADIPVKLSLLHLAILVPCLLAGMRSAGVTGAAWGTLAAAIVMLPVTYVAIVRLLRPRHGNVVAMIWRPVLASLAMLVVVRGWMQWLGGAGYAESHLIALFSSVCIGAATYVLAITLLWRIAGMPNGAESKAIAAVTAKLRGAWARRNEFGRDVR
jgi:O-antigen/teichoic acid export membrane protein